MDATTLLAVFVIVAVALFARGRLRRRRAGSGLPAVQPPAILGTRDDGEARREALETLERISPDVTRAYEEVRRLSDLGSGYLMKKDWDRALEAAAPVMSEVGRIPADVVRESDLAKEVTYLQARCLNPGFRERRNREYKAHELGLCGTLLSDVDGGKSLDAQQRDAVVTDEYSNLVIAGAGSGKTAVVVGKVKYLVERWGVDPSEILVTSFTRASVDDLRARIEASGVKGVAAKTFHALGLEALGNDYAVAAEGQLQKHVTAYLSGELASRPVQAAAFLEFFGLWSLAPDESPDSKEAELRMKVLKAQDMRTLKGLVEESHRGADLDTLCGERVKSVEELMIANFLFLNGVAYEYERPYPNPIPEELQDEGRRAYQPDFYLTDYDIWLEHFGVDSDGRVPWLKSPVEERRYLDGMGWKRNVHAACGTRLIESYSYWNKDQDLLNQVEALLRGNGVELRIDPERNARICGELMRDERFFSSMTQLISTFISLFKSGDRSVAEVDDAAREAYRGNGAMWHRYDLFTRFAWPILRSYQDSLANADKPLVDFDDMINKAAARIREGGYGKAYRYIIVDEYQDISLSRFGLLSAIREATGAKLMCVGDDWQAIYRFAGSDVTLFTSFGKLVGFHEEMRIESTYRNSQRLVDVASRFVLKNPDQLRKAVRSKAPAQDGPPVRAISLADQQAAFTFALKDLLSSPGGGGDVKVLGRNRRDLERIFPELAPTGAFSFREPKRGDPAEEKFDRVIVCSQPGRPTREIGYMTVHKSKGLQADNVIVIGLTNERYGFPNMVADDPILQLLLADSDRYVYAEERRLFYVALTRTRNRVWLVAGEDAGNPGVSVFVDELRRECDGESFAFYQQAHADGGAACPCCGGALLRRHGPSGDFVGCSNYPFCDKTYRDVRILEDRMRCPSCGGWLTRRTKDGVEFFGCTNYPKYCTYTKSLGGRGAAKQGAKGAREAKMEYSRASSSPAGSERRAAPRCPKCGASMVLRSGPYGSFYGCPNYPSCKGTRERGPGGRQGQQREPRGKTTPRCPACGAPMVLRSGRYGKFYGCSKYPSCKGKRSYKG